MRTGSPRNSAVRPCGRKISTKMILQNTITSSTAAGYTRAASWALRLIRKNMRRLQGKKLVIFAVGLNLMNQEARMQLRQINFSKRKVQGLTCYYCPGAYDPAQVRGLDSGIIKMMVKMLESKREEEMTDDDRRLLSAVKKRCGSGRSQLYRADPGRIRPLVVRPVDSRPLVIRLFSPRPRSLDITEAKPIVLFPYFFRTSSIASSIFSAFSRLLLSEPKSDSCS